MPAAYDKDKNAVVAAKDVTEEELAAYTQIIQKFKENILAITHNKKGELL